MLVVPVGLRKRKKVLFRALQEIVLVLLVVVEKVLVIDQEEVVGIALVVEEVVDGVVAV